MTTKEMRTGPVRGKGVAAIDFDGDRYCVDCAAKVMDGRDFGIQVGDGWESVEDANGQDIAQRLIHGDIHTLSTGGVVLKDSVDTPETEYWHCGRHRDCDHALSGDEHTYDHDESVGVLLRV